MLMPNTVVPSWRARLRKLAWLLPVLTLTACSAPPAVIPRIPEPAADLMKPAPTGSEVLQRATRNMETWLPTPQDGPTR
ncbi:hypothetical protein Axylo_1822 [Achromobacter xylosoxidans]|nr:hypothetical protein Axylo_1822 [Achromobacter xylosoxidans]